MKKRVLVDISDAKISGDQDHVLTTYSLGSCIGVCVYDAIAKVGGMLHYQLPDSKLDQMKADRYPYMFADTGMRLMVNELAKKGANPKRLTVKIAGGATMATGPKGFDIGKRNYLAIRKLLWKNGLFIDSEDIGGNSPRNMYLDISDGSVMIRCIGQEKML